MCKCNADQTPERVTKEDQSRNGVRVTVFRFYDDKGLTGSYVEADCKCFGSPMRVHSNATCKLRMKQLAAEG